MNRYNEFDRNMNQRGDYDRYSKQQDRYRGSNRFNNYGDSARGGYGNEGYWDKYGNQGNESAGSRNNRSRDGVNAGMGYGVSANYGSMGSYGGAQGFGTERGGFATQKHYGNDAGSQFFSGRGERGSDMEQRREGSHNYRHHIYGAYRDRNSYEHGHGYAPSQGYGSYDPYGSQGYGSSRGMLHYDRDQRGSYDMGGTRERGNYSGLHYGDQGSYNASGNYGRSQAGGGNITGGSYMGSGYSRQTHGEYGPMVNYGQQASPPYGNQQGRHGGQVRNVHEGPTRSHNPIE